MKTFYYMGPNQENESGVSWKMWKIERRQKTVSVWWGPAVIVERKVTAVRKLVSKSWVYPTEAEAKADEERRIQQKLNGGYSKVLAKKGRRVVKKATKKHQKVAKKVATKNLRVAKKAAKVDLDKGDGISSDDADWLKHIDNLGTPMSYETISEGEYLVFFFTDIEIKVDDACCCRSCSAFRRVYPCFLPAAENDYLQSPKMFSSIREAFGFVVREMILRQHNYIVAIRGPKEVENNCHCIIQVVSQNIVFEDGEFGLTLHLAFEPGSGTELAAFIGSGLDKNCEEYRTEEGIPCFALRFDTDVERALNVIHFVLDNVYGYATEDGFECEVYDEGQISSAE